MTYNNCSSGGLTQLTLESNCTKRFLQKYIVKKQRGRENNKN